MRQYELTVLIHPDLEMNLTPALDKIKKIVGDNGGKITKEVNDGKKRLAYSINKQDFAVYYNFEVDLPAGASEKISNVLNITEEVLRYLLVTVDVRKAKYEARRKESGEEEEAEEEEK